jgi:DNA-binding beta-propeller fold protein YncE
VRTQGVGGGTLTLLLVALLTVLPTTSAATPTSTYYLYVAAESDDIVEKLAFGPDGFRIIRSIPVGIWPTETEGPHGMTISPDGRYWYVTVAHGNPYGILFKYDAETDEYLGDVNLGLFPASMVISPSTGLLFAVNFNLHGDHVPSTVSVVETESMTEVAQIPTGIMPHGSRMNAGGSRQYSVAMMDDELREIDAYQLRNRRILPLSKNAPSWEHYRQTGNGLVEEGEGADGASATEGMRHDMAMKPPLIKPTWVSQVTPQGKVYVAGNGSARLLEVDIEDWKVERTFVTAAGPYNIDVTPDGRLLVVTYKSSKSVGIWNLEDGEEVARIDTLRPLPHGVVCSPDGRYAFVTIEGIGGEPGSVEAYDLQTLQRVGNIDIAKQAGGIAIWKVE